MRVGNYELVFGIKEILAVSLAFLVALGSYSFLSMFSNGNPGSSPTFSTLSRYDSSTGSVVLTSATPIAENDSNSSCDVYVTPPDRQIRFFNIVPCDSLSSTSIPIQALRDFGNGLNGTYTVVVYSQNGGNGESFSFEIP